MSAKTFQEGFDAALDAVLDEAEKMSNAEPRLMGLDQPLLRGLSIAGAELLRVTVRNIRMAHICREAAGKRKKRGK